jgi:hypothetical protein
MGLEAGLGVSPNEDPTYNNIGTPGEAKDFGGALNRLGFMDVTDEWNTQPGYGGEPGDVAVFQPANGSNPSGHAEVWDGTQWVSDYRQQPPIETGDWAGAHFYPNLGKYHEQPYRIYRYACGCH